MTLDPYSLTGIVVLGICFSGIGFAIALILLADHDYEDDFGETCTRTKHLWQLDPKREINYCFCGQESWKTDEHNVIRIKS